MCKNDCAMKTFILMVLFFFAITLHAEDTKTYRHPAGLQFQYPAAWNVRDASMAELEFAPPDQEKNAQGLTEGYLLWGIGGSFQNPTDPTLIQYLDKVITQMAPFLKRVDQAEKISSGTEILWSGSSPDGMAVTARLLVETHDGAAYVILMMGSEDRIKLREPAFRQIFTSFHFDDGQRDASLAANWSSGDATQTQAASDASLKIDIQKDGTFAFEDSSQDSAGYLKGKWYASGGKLCFIAPDSFFIDFQYEIAGQPGSRKLTLHHASGGIQILNEVATPK